MGSKESKHQKKEETCINTKQQQQIMESKPKNTFRLATLNVHGWEDACGDNNVERIIALVKKHDPDVLCLQESSHDEQARFIKESKLHWGGAVNNMEGVVKFCGCTVISKFPLKVRKWEMKRRCRIVTAEIELPGGSSKPLFVSSIHLDHRLEPSRLVEEEQIHKNLESLFAEDAHQIWTGDFNALTREDYTEEEWKELTIIRERNMWEMPQTQVTNRIRSRGFVDCWESAGKPRPLKTCRFDTRIDYVFASKSFLAEKPLLGVTHVQDDASDHNMVIAEFKL